MSELSKVRPSAPPQGKVVYSCSEYSLLKYPSTYCVGSHSIRYPLKLHSTEMSLCTYIHVDVVPDCNAMERQYSELAPRAVEAIAREFERRRR